jgi:protein-L-isoaspartate(D-aspartate) O-methyltransferase
MKVCTRKTSGLLLALVLCATTLSACSQGAGEKKSFVDLRREMIDGQIKMRGITDGKILRAFMEVPREIFVEPRFKDRAYDDIEAPMAKGETLNRPYEDAMILSALAIQDADRVLEVGTGTGYLSALISRVADRVYTIEIVPEFADMARANFKTLGYENISVKTGDGFAGWEEYALFDKIVLGCSPPTIPKPLEEQLKEGGLMLVPLGGAEKFQELVLYEKRDGAIHEVRRLAPTTFSPMKGEILKKQ